MRNRNLISVIILLAASLFFQPMAMGCIGDDAAPDPRPSDPCRAWCYYYTDCVYGGANPAALDNCLAVAATDCRPVGDPAACTAVMESLACEETPEGGVIHDTDASRACVHWEAP